MDKAVLVQWAIAKVIRAARDKSGISQDKLAELSNLSYPFLSEVERGLSGMGIDALLQLAEALQVDAWKLMRRIEADLKRGPKPPEKVIGRPRKTEKKEKTPKAGKTGAAVKKKSGAAAKKKAGKTKRESDQGE